LQTRIAILQNIAMNWDDYRLVLAVAEGGSLVAAARRLGVVQSTAFRRLNALEKDMSVRLFDRSASGYAAVMPRPIYTKPLTQRSAFR
jgi:DNA-binding transcriptional LysR family regulator